MVSGYSWLSGSCLLPSSMRTTCPTICASWDVLVKDGRFHKRLANFVEGLERQADDRRVECEKLLAEMEEMDKIKREKESSGFHDGRIQLIPNGLFQFPDIKRSEVYDLLHIADDARPLFDRMYRAKAVPIANVYKDPVYQQGPGDGMVMRTGMEAWRNLYRIRKSLFERGFTRITTHQGPL